MILFLTNRKFKIFCNIINVFTVTFNQFNAALLKTNTAYKVNFFFFLYLTDFKLLNTSVHTSVITLGEIHVHVNYSFVCYRYAASVDDILEEEEHYADQLKEYLFYADALRYNFHCCYVASS